MSARRLTLLAAGTILITVAAVLVASGASATTVCDVSTAAYPTIQSAVDDIVCSVINLGSGTFTETITISRTVTIQGRGAAYSRVDGNASGSVFTIRAGATVTLTHLTITNGSSSSGGGIHVSAGSNESTAVYIVGCSITGNSATHGGAVRLYNDVFGSTRVNLIDTTVEGNSASDGGGIFSGVAGRMGSFTYARVYVTDSTLNGNTALSYGGGICNVGYSEVHITNSTISDNSGGYGGGISNYGGGVTIAYGTLSGNIATENGGGIYNYWPPPDGPPYHGFMFFSVSNSIVANSPLGGACVNDGDATVDDQGYNIIQTIECISDPTSQTSDPMLGPLQHNGGPTYTHAPSPGSPAIDSGDDASCPDADQRGVPRPLDGDGNGTAVCDIGSCEYVQFASSVFLPIISR